MKTGWFKLFVVLALLATLIPLGSAVASADSGLHFRGAIQKLPAAGLTGRWIVSGQKVRVTAATKIDQTDGRVALGKMVRVEGYRLSPGVIVATSIDVLAPQPLAAQAASPAASGQ